MTRTMSLNPLKVQCHFKMLDNFESNWVKKGRPASFDRDIPGDYVVPEPGPTMERPNNIFYLDYF